MKSYDKLKRLEIKDQCLTLPVGSSLLLHCPYCGAEHERSLSVTRKSGGLVFNCFRAKCGVSGFIGSVGNAPPAVKKKAYNSYKHHIRPVLHEELIYLWDNYGIPSDYAEEIKINEEGRYMFPSFSIVSNWYAGWQDRRFDGVGQKVVFYPEMEGPYYQILQKKSLHPYIGKPTFYIVEDYISMMKVQLAVDMERINAVAVSLMGTHISEQMAMWLAKNSSNVVFMLDNDATHKSIKYKQKYNLLWPEARIVIMQDDPKDTDILILRSLV